jgi:hypothetical protein
MIPHANYRDPLSFGSGLELPMSRTTFQRPSFCFFQIVVYFPYSTAGLPSLPTERNSQFPKEYPKSPDSKTST